MFWQVLFNIHRSVSCIHTAVYIKHNRLTLKITLIKMKRYGICMQCQECY